MFILVTFSIPPIPTGTLVFLMDVMFQVLADNLQNQLVFIYWGRAVVLVPILDLMDGLPLSHWNQNSELGAPTSGGVITLLNRASEEWEDVTVDKICAK